MKYRYSTLMFFLLVFFSSISPCFAAIDVYEFEDPRLAVRFKQLTSELRCPKCQNQNLAGSNSTLSLDLKQIVYEKLKAGETDQQILEFMRQRYGEFILFNPEMSQSNVILWAGPIIFLVLFLVFFLRWYANNREVNDE
jgi:cytochrome c-type biogenesis protein CcmH